MAAGRGGSKEALGIQNVTVWGGARVCGGQEADDAMGLLGRRSRDSRILARRLLDAGGQTGGNKEGGEGMVLYVAVALTALLAGTVQSLTRLAMARLLRAC